jgi:ribosome-associated protein
MDIKKLQALVIDALEDVKAQDIKLFDTTHLTALFDRIAIASGTSNRQTKALAASVRDKVKENGGNVVSMEGEDTGEWVLVDLGDMIVHIMQPAIRQYYRLEEIWGDKEVALGAAKRKSTVEGRRRAEAASKHLAANQAGRRRSSRSTRKPVAKRATTAKGSATAPPRRRRRAKTAAKIESGRQDHQGRAEPDRKPPSKRTKAATETQGRAHRGRSQGGAPVKRVIKRVVQEGAE